MRPTREAVQQALTRLRAADPTLKQFGAQGHGYRLNPPLAEAEAVAVEQRLGVSLPTEYRAFVTQVGDGGAGPGYGVHSLREWLATAQAAGRKARRRAGELVDPARPFGRPVTVAEAARLGGFPTHGVIPLCETGCGGAYCLVTAGTEQGWVWCYDNGGFYAPAYTHDPVYPVGATVADRLRINEAFLAALLALSNNVRLGFWAWYQCWLEEAGQGTVREVAKKG
jgi:hypothetical protein